MVSLRPKARRFNPAANLSPIPPVIVQSLGAALESHEIAVQEGIFDVDFVVRVSGSVSFNSHGEPIEHDLKIDYQPSRTAIDKMYCYVSIKNRYGREVRPGRIMERFAAAEFIGLFNRISSPRFTARIEPEAKVRVSV